MGVAVRRYIDILIIIITFPYSACIRSFFGSSIPTSLFIFFLFFFVLWYNNRRSCTRPYVPVYTATATPRVIPRIYCVCALVGGAISIRDPYIFAISRVCANESHAVFHRPVVCTVKT